MTAGPSATLPPAVPAVGRLEFETLISDISAQLMAALPEQVEAAVRLALDRVRVFFGADRGGLLVVSQDGRWARVTHEADGEGVASVSGDLNLAELFPWSAARLLVERLPSIVERFDDLPLEAAVDRDSWNRFAPMRSNLSVPIQQGAAVTHVVALHWVHKECAVPDVYVPRLRLLGEVCVNALQRKQAFDALRASEERLDCAAASAQCGLWELVVATRAIWASDETRRLYGIEAREPFTYERFAELVHPEDRERVERAVNESLANAGTYAAEYRIVLPGGAIRWIRAAGRVNGSGSLLGTSIDITERRQQEEDLRRALEQVQELRDRLQNENVYLREQTSRALEQNQIVGRSPAIRRAIALSEQVAATNATVLLTGETGTGKERFATLIHEASSRAGHAMVRVNCSAIPTALIESELFGREKGAYTGAMSRQIGRFEMADGSTLFLDEVSDLPLEVQVKLLRVLQERTIERLGSPRPHAVDVRIIAATNHDLEQAVREGRFRSDLFYRLNVFPIHVPPLRERPEDIPALVSVLLEEIGLAMGRRGESVTKTTMEALQRYPWPGNVRELRNLLERAVILASGPVLHIDMPSGAALPPGITAPASLDGRLEDVERDHIVGVLRKTGWRVKGPGSASVLLGMKPSTLYSRMKKLGIARPH